jgi:hypothetical protein
VVDEFGSNRHLVAMPITNEINLKLLDHARYRRKPSFGAYRALIARYGIGLPGADRDSAPPGHIDG